MTNREQSHNNNLAKYWPEMVRSKPRRSRFPLKALLKGVLPGVVVLALLFIPWYLLQGEASKNIVFVDPNGQLNAIQANLENPQKVGQPPLQLDAAAQAELIQQLPVLAQPEWSPDNAKLAATVMVNNTPQVVLFNTISQTTDVLFSPTNVTNKVVTHGQSWSPNSDRLALLETDGENAFLSLVHLDREELIPSPVNVSLDARGGLDWHPQEDTLLVTTLPDGTSSSTLQLIDVETGRAEPFSPNDQNILRTNGMWSPDGNQIAYLVPESTQPQENGLYAGAIWVANRDGSNARELVAPGLNMAPFWHPADRNHIYFTFQDTIGTGTVYRLYRINVFVGSDPELVADSNSEAIRYPFDTERFVRVADTALSGVAPIRLATVPASTVSPSDRTPETVIRQTIERSLPTSGAPVWSPDGRYLATTNWQNGKIAPIIYNDNLEQIASIGSNFDVMAIPADGWSADGSAVTLIESDGTNAFLSLWSAPFGNGGLTIYDTFLLDQRARLNWHPSESQLLVTGRVDEAAFPEIFLLSPGEENPQVLTLGDGLAMKADAVWSPDGTQIAYTATDDYVPSQAILPGALWLASSDGSQSTELVADSVIAPRWSSSGDAIYYIRVNGELGRFTLYRLSIVDGTPPEYVGVIHEEVILRPFDTSQLLQWSADEQQLLFPGLNPLPTDFVFRAAPPDIITQIQEELPILGVSSWSPTNEQFAGTIFQSDTGDVQAAIYKSVTAPPLLSPSTNDRIVVPADGWSPDGNYLALLRYDGVAPQIGVMDTVQSSLRMTPFTIETRAGMSWHPFRPEVMVTSLDEEITPTLRIFNVAENLASRYMPDDGQAVHADGVYAPDGSAIAYIAQETITPTIEAEYFAGPLWMADATGEKAILLVPDGLNFAPIWDVTDTQSRILFTRFITETETFEMFQVLLDEGFPVTSYGPSSEAFATYPFDRSYFSRWSPQGILWNLPNSAPISFYDYYRVESDRDVVPLPTSCVSGNGVTVNWAPTTRGVLVACSSGEMALQWLDDDRTDGDYPAGLYPTWQP